MTNTNTPVDIRKLAENLLEANKQYGGFNIELGNKLAQAILSPAAPSEVVEGERGALKRIASTIAKNAIYNIIRDVSELDRDSPENEPDMLLVRHGELEGILQYHLNGEGFDTAYELARSALPPVQESVLPYEVKIGSTVFSKGLPLSTLIKAAERWNKQAADTFKLPAPAQALPVGEREALLRECDTAIWMLSEVEKEESNKEYLDQLRTRLKALSQSTTAEQSQ